MKDGRRNVLGDLVMASVTGCAAFIGFIAICLVLFTSLGIILSLLKLL